MQASVIRRRGIIGEAAGRISPQFREEHPEILWNEIRGIRNRMIHRYDDIDTDMLWGIVQQDVPRLLHLIKPLALPEVQ